MSRDDRKEIRKKVSNGLRQTLENQINRRDTIPSRATQLISADLLAISIIVGFLSSKVSVVFFSASLTSLIVSIYYCAQVLIPDPMVIGFGKGVEEAREIDDVLAYHDEVIDQYLDFIEENEEVAQHMTRSLQNGIWASFAGVLFFSASAVTQLLQFDLPVGIRIVVLLLVPILAFYGRDRQERTKDKGEDRNSPS